ncbi:MAG: hypothetical protein A3K03_08685 [Bdellovibrionales bacterium RIFOXYD1_FULL_44_7]|nr:MAG: hypothetical protein A3K03_08685 [Bdellovibrionales bacterium RIFOXYD1_FULL_44_7]
MDEYRFFLADNKLRVKTAIDTHFHSDHLSATHIMKAEYGSSIAMSENTGSKRVDVKLKEGSKIRVGDISLEVLFTPGHAGDAICLRLVHHQSECIFTGCTLLIGAVGRVGLPGSDCGDFFKSLRRLEGLKDDTIIFPGRDPFGRLFTVLKKERNDNTEFNCESVERFTEIKSNQTVGTVTEEINRCFDYNRSASPSSFGDGIHRASVLTKSIKSDNSNFSCIGVTKYLKILESNSSDNSTLFLDVREQEEFNEARIPRHVNIALSNLAFSLNQIQEAKKVFILCLTERRSSLATRTLNYIGIKDVVLVNGGFRAWTQAGFPTVKAL